MDRDEILTNTNFKNFQTKIEILFSEHFQVYYTDDF